MGVRARYHGFDGVHGASLGRRSKRPGSARALCSLVGNRGMNAAHNAPLPAGRGMPPQLAAMLATSPAASTSPPRTGKAEELAAVEEGLHLTTPPEVTENPLFESPWSDNPLYDDTPAAATTPVAVQDPDKLTVKGSGGIEGKFKISDYWPGVSVYWGSDRRLGKFDKKITGSPGWRMIGHKFQVVGRFKSGTTTTGAGGNVEFLQEARITTTKGGAAGPWFNDMDYTDASGGAHQWDPNAEAGTTGATGYAGVRRTIAKNKYAYTDPPALPYQPGVTNDYRKLEFKIHLKPPPGSGKPELIKFATQEIEIVKGKPKVLQAP
jgi:hypothetical protein